MVSYYSQLLFPEHFNYTSYSTKMKSAPQHMTWPTPLSSMVSRDLRMCKTLSKYRFFCDNICNAVFRTMPQSLGLKLNSECWRKKREKRASTDKLPQLLGTQRQRKPKFNYVKDDASLENQIVSMVWNQWQQEVNQLKEEISLRDDEIQKLQKGNGCLFEVHQHQETAVRQRSQRPPERKGLVNTALWSKNSTFFSRCHLLERDMKELQEQKKNLKEEDIEMW